MVGRNVQLVVDRGESHPAEPRLVVTDLHVADDRGHEAVKGVSFDVRAGEILGIAGVAGNGQDELVEALTGLRKPTSGHRRTGRPRRHRARARATSSGPACRSCRATATASAWSSASRSRTTSS